MNRAERLAKLAFLVQQGAGNQTGAIIGADVRHDVVLVDPHGKQQKFDKITPLLEKPATEPFFTHWGGGRAYGGGLSKEAKRRAKRKDSS